MRAFVDDYGSAEPIADWCFDEEVDFSSLQQTRASTGEAPEGFRCGYDALDLDSGSGARELSAHGAIVPWVGPANYYASRARVRPCAFSLSPLSGLPVLPLRFDY